MTGEGSSRRGYRSYSPPPAPKPWHEGVGLLSREKFESNISQFGFEKKEVGFLYNSYRSLLKELARQNTSSAYYVNLEIQVRLVSLIDEGRVTEYFKELKKHVSRPQSAILIAKYFSHVKSLDEKRRTFIENRLATSCCSSCYGNLEKAVVEDDSPFLQEKHVTIVNKIDAHFKSPKISMCKYKGHIYQGIDTLLAGGEDQDSIVKYILAVAGNFR